MAERTEDQSAVQIARLRGKAAHCRKLALEAVSHGVASELESIAREYDGDAAKIELRLP